jgi:hypothetical protein
MRYLTLVFVFASCVLAASDAPPVWRWETKDRLAERFDETRIRERARGRVATDRAGNASEGAYSPEGGTNYIIDGSRNPELLLPFELFDALMTGWTVVPSLRAKQRAYYAPSIRAAGMNDEALWDALQSVSGEYLLLRYGGVQQSQGPSGSTAAADDALCRARYDALEKARALYGREQFDRMLFTAIAPSVRSALATSNAAEHRARLERADEGCR